MTDADLHRIEAMTRAGRHPIGPGPCLATCADVAALVAEVRRLRAAVLAGRERCREAFVRAAETMPSGRVARAGSWEAYEMGHRQAADQVRRLFFSGPIPGQRSAP